MYEQMFRSVQLDILKRAAKIDSGKKASRNNNQDFPYLYGYTDNGDVALMSSFAVYLVYPEVCYIDLRAAFRREAIPTSQVMRILDDKNAYPAEMTADLKQMENGTTVHVFEVENGEQVLIDTKLFKPFKDMQIELKFKASNPISPVFVYNDLGRKVGMVLPVRPPEYDSKRRY